MSMQDLVGGDCSGSNSMLKLADHMTRDQSMFRDPRMNPGNFDNVGPSTRDDFVREFLGNQPAGPSQDPVERMRERMENAQLNEYGGPPMSWADEFSRMPPPQMEHFNQDFERYYHESQAMHQRPHEWMEDYRQFESEIPKLTEEETSMMERVYQDLSRPEWASEFSDQREKEKIREFQDESTEANLEEIWSKMRSEIDYEDDEFLDPSGFNPFASKRIEDKPYEFESNNPFLSRESPFQEGIQLSENGNLSDAALAYEAAVQKDPNHAEAWYKLGEVQQENEKEIPAISALRMAVQLNPDNCDASLALAVSYTNEGAETQALDALENWIRAKYKSFKFTSTEENPMNRHENIVNLYLEIVRSSKEIDPDVQICLGVLFNISSEYDKAIDCFQAAVQVRPNDYIIWNRLGATMANGGKSEQAIDAYYRALELKPSFVRARYNLGVSCINIGCYKEAAEHFLGALALHGDTNSQKNVSNNLWESLKRTFLMMERRDLFDKAQTHHLDGFRSDFEF